MDIFGIEAEEKEFKIKFLQSFFFTICEKDDTGEIAKLKL